MEQKGVALCFHPAMQRISCYFAMRSRSSGKVHGVNALSRGTGVCCWRWSSLRCRLDAAAQAPQTRPAENWGAPEIVEVQAAPGPAVWHLTRGDSEVWILGTVGSMPDGLTWNKNYLGELAGRRARHPVAAASVHRRVRRRLVPDHQWQQIQPAARPEPGAVAVAGTARALRRHARASRPEAKTATRPTRRCARRCACNRIFRTSSTSPATSRATPSTAWRAASMSRPRRSRAMKCWTRRKTC